MMHTHTLRSLAVLAAIVCALGASLASAQGTYAPQVDIATALQPAAVRSGDVDDDGDLDFVVASNGTNTIEVYTNDGTGVFSLFSSTLLSPAGLGPVGLVITRLDNGTSLDVAVANGFNNTVSILLNDGVGHFTLSNTFTVGNGPLSITASDFDNDGDNDLVTANFQGNNVTLLLNLGNANFGVGTSPFIGARPTNCLFNDIDKDGDQDFILLLGGFNLVVIYQNIGTNFVFDAAYPTGVLPLDIAIGDVDFSGRGDLLVTCPGSNQVSILRSTGVRAFQPATNISVPRRPVRIVTTQSDNAFGVDFAVTTFDGYKIQVYRNTGNATFALATDTLVGVNPASLICADVDGDHFDDLASANFGAATVALLRNVVPANPYPGTGEDIMLGTGVNVTPSSGVGEYVKFARVSDMLFVSVISPGGTFDNTQTIMAAQLFFAGFPPVSPFPGFYLNSFVFGAIVLQQIPALPSGGFLQFAFVPPGLEGLSVMLQAASITPVAANGILAATDGYEIRFTP